MYIPTTTLTTGSSGGGEATVISDQILAAGTTAIDVSSISDEYADLELRFVGRCDTAAALDLITMRFNNDSGSNYDTQYVHYSSNSANAAQSLAQTQFGLAGTTTVCFIPGASAVAGAHGELTIWIRNYANTVFRKGFTSQGLGKTGDGSGETFLVDCVGEWRSTAAVNQVRLGLIGVGEFIIGSRFTIIGHGTKTPA